MQGLAILWLSFIESFGTILLERGVYFYTRERFGFGATANLWLALAFGLLYAAGAASSHHLTARRAEKPVLCGAMLTLLVLHAVLAVWPTPTSLVASFALIGFAHGLKWPIIESYVGAGRTANEMPKALARFNLAWALAVPPAVASAGAVADLGSARTLFIGAALSNALGFIAVATLPRVPQHLRTAEHHARDSSWAGTETAQERLPTASAQQHAARQLARLLYTARYGLFASYTLLFLLCPLLPEIFAKVGLDARHAGVAASALDAARVGMFALLGSWTAWRGHLSLIWLSVIALPFAAAGVLFAPELWLVLTSEVLFGVASGFGYTAALYYALVAERAHVSAGGAHESVIGLGLGVGPAVGLAAGALAPWLGSAPLALALCFTPILVLVLFGALRAARPNASRGDQLF